MSHFIRFTEHPEKYLFGRGPKPEDLYIDPEKVAMVIPHETYTTLLVDGKWVQVEGDGESIRGLLRRNTG